MLPRITVVTPSFNQGQFLETTIRSVVEQGYDNLEYIIIDGGSVDQSVDIIKQYSSYISYWISEKDQGQSNAINKGLSLASGEILCWINSDDFLEPECLRKVAMHFERNPSWDCITGGCNLIYHNTAGQIIHRAQRAPSEAPHRAIFNWKEEWFPQQATFWRASLWKKSGPLREDLKFTMDLELWRRFSKLTQIQSVPDILATYRFHQDAKCVSQLIPSIMEEFRINTEIYNNTDVELLLTLEGQIRALATQITNLQTNIQQYEKEHAKLSAENAMLKDAQDSLGRSRIYRFLSLIRRFIRK